MTRQKTLPHFFCLFSTNMFSADEPIWTQYIYILLIRTVQPKFCDSHMISFITKNKKTKTKNPHSLGCNVMSYSLYAFLPTNLYSIRSVCCYQVACKAPCYPSVYVLASVHLCITKPVHCITLYRWRCVHLDRSPLPWLSFTSDWKIGTLVAGYSVRHRAFTGSVQELAGQMSISYDWVR